MPAVDLVDETFVVVDRATIASVVADPQRWAAVVAGPAAHGVHGPRPRRDPLVGRRAAGPGRWRSGSRRSGTACSCTTTPGSTRSTRRRTAPGRCRPTSRAGAGPHGRASRRARAWKRTIWALKDELEAGRPVGERRPGWVAACRRHPRGSRTPDRPARTESRTAPAVPMLQTCRSRHAARRAPPPSPRPRPGARCATPTCARVPRRRCPRRPSTVVPGVATGSDLVDSTVSGRHAAAAPVEAPRSGGSGGVRRTARRTRPVAAPEQPHVDPPGAAALVGHLARGSRPADRRRGQPGEGRRARRADARSSRRHRDRCRRARPRGAARAASGASRRA